GHHAIEEPERDEENDIEHRIVQIEAEAHLPRVRPREVERKQRDEQRHQEHVDEQRHPEARAGVHWPRRWIGYGVTRLALHELLIDERNREEVMTRLGAMLSVCVAVALSGTTF